MHVSAIESTAALLLGSYTTMIPALSQGTTILGAACSAWHSEPPFVTSVDVCVCVSVDVCVCVCGPVHHNSAIWARLHPQFRSVGLCH